MKVLPPKANKSAWVERRCKYCQEMFYARRAAILHTNASGNFCSRPCYNMWQRGQVGPLSPSYKKITITCYECGTPIFVIPSKMSTYSTHFCSPSCRSSYHGLRLRRGRTPYGAEWKEARATAIKEQVICAFCGSTHNLHIHHIVPWRLSHSHSPDNLIPLCRKHHAQVERYTEGLLSVGSTTRQLFEIFGNTLRSAQMTSVASFVEVAHKYGVEVNVQCV